MRPSTLPLSCGPSPASWPQPRSPRATQLHQRHDCGQARTVDLPRLGKQGLHSSPAADDPRHPGAEGGSPDNSSGHTHDREGRGLPKNQSARPGGVLSGARRLRRTRRCRLSGDEFRWRGRRLDVTITVKATPTPSPPAGAGNSSVSEAATCHRLPPHGRSRRRGEHSAGSSGPGNARAATQDARCAPCNQAVGVLNSPVCWRPARSLRNVS